MSTTSLEKEIVAARHQWIALALPVDLAWKTSVGAP